MKSTVIHTSLGTWTVQFREEPAHAVAQKRELLPLVDALLQQHRAGSLTLDEDIGGRSWFSRTVLGLNPRILQMHLTLEWSDGVASLVFFDDASSEHRAMDPSHAIQASDAIRTAIAHGEAAPLPFRECLELNRARRAIEEFLETGKRPDWLQYEYIA